ncbi:GAF domain-containing protein [Rhodovulum tesquicola]|uniref:GAF domain-containing protein n=1 Tax=Rhodovulum tesquicola TaxID=540254 RepID=UPI002097AF91|nr:GAF domain-containing protein [Rhodovulum tesquicola]MCO8146768.1 GAF domain-containing protein [Rhodovulum tesquicola]
MTAPCLDTLRPSLEGVVASVIATCDAEGLPNVSMISQVHYVDPERVALSYQFFNKTRRNLLATRRASVQIVDPETMQQHRLALDYEETLTSGPLFESMKAKLAGIASHHGMEGVFRLLGADIFRVLSIEPVPGPKIPRAARARPLLAATRRACAALDACTDLEELLDRATEVLAAQFGIRHAMVLMAEDGEDRLYAVASRGYRASGVGAEVQFGEGVIGVAARERTPIRIGHMTREYRYGAAITETARRAGLIEGAPRTIPFPGLAAPRSQIALPILEGGRLLGVLFAEAEETMRFAYDDEDALALVAGHLGARIAILRADETDEDHPAPGAALPLGGGVTVRYYAVDQSVFVDHDYLIKGVAGAILWRLLQEFQATGRTDFALRELRVDPALRLPAHGENLDARMILLRRRLEERQSCLRIEKAGRGRFRLAVACRLTLEEPA